jgi:hypothetical protein
MSELKHMPTKNPYTILVNIYLRVKIVNPTLEVMTHMQVRINLKTLEIRMENGEKELNLKEVNEIIVMNQGSVSRCFLGQSFGLL